MVYSLLDVLLCQWPEYFVPWQVERTVWEEFLHWNFGVPILLRLEFCHGYIFQKWNKSPYEFRKYQDSDLEKTMCYYKSPPEVCDFRWAFGIDIFIWSIPLLRKQHHNFITSCNKSSHFISRKRLVCDHSKVIELFAEGRYMFRILVFKDILN